MSICISKVKGLAETLSIEGIFLSRLQIGETILTCSSSNLVYTGTDVSPSSMLVGSPAISGTSVTQKITGGVSGVIYTITLVANTSLSNVYIQEIKIAVIPSQAG